MNKQKILLYFALSVRYCVLAHRAKNFLVVNCRLAEMSLPLRSTSFVLVRAWLEVLKFEALTQCTSIG